MLLAESNLWIVFGRVVQQVFGGDAPERPLELYQVAARAVAVFVIGLTIIRLGKNRMISRITSIDIIFGFLVGSLLSRGVTGGVPLSATAVASATIAVVHWLLSLLAFRWAAVGAVVKGRETVLIRDGEPVSENLSRMQISRHDLEEELRLNQVQDVREVRLAYQERNGHISVFKERPPPCVLEVSVQEGVQTVRIHVA